MLTIIDDFSRKVWTYFWNRKMKYFPHSRSEKFWLRTRLEKGSRGSAQIMFWNYVKVISNYFVKMKELLNTTLLSAHRSKMALQNVSKRQLWKESVVCSQILACPKSFGQKALQRLAIWWIDLHIHHLNSRPADYLNLKVFGYPVYAHVNQGN